MKKDLQRAINEAVEDNYTDALAELESKYGEFWGCYAPCKKLRSCNALVYETDNFYVLQSYRTVVAVISKATNALYDALRTVYGYTATSAQHIAKFRNDYGSPYADRFTARYVPD